MGYFNIFYKITRIIDMLTRKRNRKVIAVILIAITLIWFLHTKGYCAQDDTTYTTDTTYFMIEEYNILCDYFVTAFNKWYGKSDSQTQRFNAIFDAIESGHFPYFYSVGDNAGNMRMYLYDRSTSKTLVDTNLTYNNGTYIPTTAYNFTWLAGNTYYYFDLRVNQSTTYFLATSSQSVDVNYTVPFILLYKVPTQIIECMEKAGYTYQDTTAIVNIQTKLNQIYNRLDTTNDKLTGINDSLTDSDYDENVIDFDTDSVDNVDDTEITGLFTGVIGSFSNALNSYGGTITKIIPLPHGRSNRNTK